MNERARILFIALFAIAAVAVSSREADSIFEHQYIYGFGAVSASQAGLASGSYFDTLDYLSNPAALDQIHSTRCTFSMANYGAGDIYNLAMKYYLFSCARRKKAYTFLSGEEAGVKRDTVTYTLSKQSKTYNMGANISAFRFTTPPSANFVGDPIPGDDGTAFTVELGAYKEFPNGIRAGAVVHNLISKVSDVADRYNQKESLPLVVSLGLTYPLRKWLDISAGFKIISYDNPSSDSSGKDKMLFLGMEYKPGDRNYSVRTGFQSESVVTRTYKDRAITFGAGYRTEKYDAAIAAYNYHDVYSSPLIFNVSYMTEPGEWKEPWLAGRTPEPITPQQPAENKPQYEEPLPSTNPPTTEPATAGPSSAETMTSQPAAAGAEPADTGSGIGIAQSDSRKTTQAADFKVDPKVIIIPSFTSPVFYDLANHWSLNFVTSLASDGMYPKKGNENFGPSSIAPREEFYRLLFLTQLIKLFADPITVYFKTPYAVNAQAYLDSPRLENAVLLIEGTYERAGSKRLVVNRSIIEGALDETDVTAGRYKVLLSLKHKDLLPRNLEDYITVLDTSMEFSSIAALPEDRKKIQIQNLKGSLATLGLNLDYLDGLMSPGGVPRIEALRIFFSVAGVKLPTDFSKTGLFTDISHLGEEDQAVVFLASRGMRSLGGRPLMDGYPDHTFRPQKELTNAEIAVLIDRFRALVSSDFEPPYLPPAHPEPAPYPEYQESVLITQVPRAGTEPVSRRPAPTSYYLISGSFMDKENALQEIERLRKLGYNPIIVVENMDRTIIHHTAVKGFSSLAEAQAALASAGQELFNPRIISFYKTGAASPAAPQTTVKRPVTPPQQSQTRPSNTEGELPLSGESSMPRNLIRNISDYEPDSTDGTNVIE